MQEKDEKKSPERRSNSQRSDEMRARLMTVAREIFIEKGFAGAGTPEIVKRAKVTRGALYHHFADKTDLFRALVKAETDQLGVDISAMATDAVDPEQALRLGTKAYFASMNVAGRCQILLVDGPAVLGPSEMSTLHAQGARATLLKGIKDARPSLPQAEAVALSVALSAAYDRAALAISLGEADAPYVNAMMALVRAAMTG